MEYIAFLRGINISGKNKIAMSELKKLFEKLAFSKVSTYLNSGNVRFVSNESETLIIRNKIENAIFETYGMEIPVYVECVEELKTILKEAPVWWGTEDKNQYDNLIFVLSENTPHDIAYEIGAVSEGLEQIEVKEKVIFWTFDKAMYQKCNWWKKTATAGIAEKLTIRTANTVKKAIYA